MPLILKVVILSIVMWQHPGGSVLAVTMSSVATRSSWVLEDTIRLQYSLRNAVEFGAGVQEGCDVRRLDEQEKLPASITLNTGGTSLTKRTNQIIVKLLLLSNNNRYHLWKAADIARGPFKGGLTIPKLIKGGLQKNKRPFFVVFDYKGRAGGVGRNVKKIRSYLYK